MCEVHAPQVALRQAGEHSQTHEWCGPSGGSALKLAYCGRQMFWQSSFKSVAARSGTDRFDGPVPKNPKHHTAHVVTNRVQSTGAHSAVWGKGHASTHRGTLVTSPRCGRTDRYTLYTRALKAPRSSCAGHEKGLHFGGPVPHHFRRHVAEIVARPALDTVDCTAFWGRGRIHMPRKPESAQTRLVFPNF